MRAKVWIDSTGGDIKNGIRATILKQPVKGDAFVTVLSSKGTRAKDLQRIQSTYSVRDISRQFGLSESSIRRWTKKGVITAATGAGDGESRYDFYALTQLRRIRELRNRGLTMQQIESELHGQMNLFPERGGTLIQLPARRSALEEALFLHEAGDARAKDMYRLAILQGDAVADAYCNLGILEFEAHEMAKAVDYFTSALKADPKHFESHFNLAHLYFEAGDYRLAELHYEISAVLEPHTASVYFNLALVYALKGGLEAALESLGKAREYATEEEIEQVEELLAGITKSLMDKQPADAPAESPPEKTE